ncbi:hypothetical protein HBH70_121360 [Parastagonospora nodorum]|nr:hypothetical protein HBH51_144290 [Parastagonospora nodorum]KAH3989550.1 hypothetical protein HBH52_019290 [Parastagonospora nodorum]KAH3998137.1 hypothetical protein HBI10_132170 [Parastagonospora nodorum]KAH4057391.1 hypothetical protein HBH49_045740 [Parastagonospora nodorum]KAH4096110.1 hypothetical protein HBH48_052460 [Parastagonospora nodorum]
MHGRPTTGCTTVNPLHFEIAQRIVTSRTPRPTKSDPPFRWWTQCLGARSEPHRTRGSTRRAIFNFLQVMLLL